MNRNRQSNKGILYGMLFFSIMIFYISQSFQANFLYFIQIAFSVFAILFYLPQTQGYNLLMTELLATGWFRHYGEISWTVFNLNKILILCFLLIAMVLSRTI